MTKFFTVSYFSAAYFSTFHEFCLNFVWKSISKTLVVLRIPLIRSSLRSLSLPAIILFQGWVSSVRRCILSITVTTEFDDSEQEDIAGAGSR